MKTHHSRTMRPSNTPAFWRWLGKRFLEVSRLHGESCSVRIGTHWAILGTPDGVKAFTRLSLLGSEALGFRGSEQAAVDFWLDGVSKNKEPASP